MWDDTGKERERSLLYTKSEDDDVAKYPNETKSSWGTTIGVILVAVVGATWVLMAEFVQDDGYMKDHVLFVRYLVTSTFSASALIGFILKHCFGQKSEYPVERRSFFLRTAPWAFVIGWGFNYSYGYMWYLSLQHTSAAVNNSVYQVQCVFVYILSVIFIPGELITVGKSLAVLFSIAGVFLICFDSANDTDDDPAVGSGIKTTFEGVIACAISALLYACFKVSAKVVEQKHYEQEWIVRDSQYFIGNCGIVCLITGPLFLYAAHKLNLEHFDLPTDEETIYIISEICGLNLVCNSLIVVCIAFLSPFAVSLGLLVTIPGTYLADWLFGKMKHTPGWRELLGVSLIVLGFLVLHIKVRSLAMNIRSRTSLRSRLRERLTGMSKKYHCIGHSDTQDIFISDKNLEVEKQRIPN